MADCRRGISRLAALDTDTFLKPPLRQPTDFKRALSVISEIPESLLRAELLRRAGTQSTDSADAPSCGSRERGAYNTPLHVMALFLILGLSTFGTRRFPCLLDTSTDC